MNKLTELFNRFNSYPTKVRQLFCFFFVLGLIAMPIFKYSKTFINRSFSPTKEVVKTPKSKKKQVEQTPVVVLKAEYMDLERYFSTFSHLLPWKSIKVNLAHKVTVAHVLVKTGDRVKKGQYIAILSSKVAELREKLKVSNFKLKEEEYKAAKKLVQKKFISRNEYNRKKMEIKNLEIRREIANIEAKTKYVISPIDGVIADIKFKEGDYVDKPQDYFVKIIDNTAFKVKLHLPQAVANKLKLGDDVEIKRKKLDTGASGKYEYAMSKIETISPVIDPKTGSVEVALALKGNLPPWRSGMYVQIEIRTDFAEDAVVIRNDSLIYEKQKPILYRVVASTDQKKSKVAKAEKITPVLGLTNGKYTQVITGIKARDNIVIEGQGALVHDSAVEVISP